MLWTILLIVSMYDLDSLAAAIVAAPAILVYALGFFYCSYRTFKLTTIVIAMHFILLFLALDPEMQSQTPNLLNVTILVSNLAEVICSIVFVLYTSMGIVKGRSVSGPSGYTTIKKMLPKSDFTGV